MTSVIVSRVLIATRAVELTVAVLEAVTAGEFTWSRMSRADAAEVPMARGVIGPVTVELLDGPPAAPAVLELTVPDLDAAGERLRPLLPHLDAAGCDIRLPESPTDPAAIALPDLVLVIHPAG